MSCDATREAVERHGEACPLCGRPPSAHTPKANDPDLMKALEVSLALARAKREARRWEKQAYWPHVPIEAQEHRAPVVPDEGEAP